MLRRPHQRLYPLEIESCVKGYKGKGTKDASKVGSTGGLKGVDATDQEEDGGGLAVAQPGRVAAM